MEAHTDNIKPSYTLFLDILVNLGPGKSIALQSQPHSFFEGTGALAKWTFWMLS